MRVQYSTPFIALCLAGGVLLAGCAGLGGGAEPTSGAGDAPESPLQKYWSLLAGGQDQAEVDRQNAEVQEKVAECMGEQGFDYVPDTQGGGSFVMSDDSGLDWGSEEFAKTYGYGITTDPLGMGDGPEDPHVDPNADFIASLSDTEQAAYNNALWGLPSDASPNEPQEYDWQKAGCMGAAQHDVFGEGGFGSDPEFDALSEGMNSLYTEVRESPIVQEKEADWSDCLADAGFDHFEHKDDASAAISEEYSALFSPPDGEASTSTAPPEPDPAALDALRLREIAQATADYGCARDSGYAETLTSVQFRIEQAFVDEHKTELDALVARYGDTSK
jgi:hypothetical protein